MRVLYVATDLRDADILQQEVRRVAPGLTMEICAGLSELRARPDQSSPADVLLMDCSLTEVEQLQLIHYARVRQLGVPIVGVMAANGATPSAALSAGLDDLLVRGPKFADRLQPALRLLTERYRTISQTIRENEKLKKSEARLRLIIEAMPTGVLLLDQAGRILAMNAAGVHLFGAVSPQDVVGRAFATLIPVEDQPAFQEFLRKASGGEEASVQFSSLHEEGEAARVFNLRGLCIQRDDAGQQALLGVIDRIQAGALGVEHAWNADFDLGVSGLAGPVLDLIGEEDARARVADLETQAAEAAARAATFEAQAGAAQVRLAELESAHAAARQAAEERSRQLEAEVVRLRAAQEAAEGRATTTTEQLTQAQEQHAALVVECGSLRQALWNEQEQRTAAEARLQAASAAAEELTKQGEAIASLAGELEGARGELAALQDRLAQEQRALQEEQRARQEEQRGREEERAAREHLQAVLGQAQSHGSEVETEVASVRAELASLAAQLGQVRVAYETLQAAQAQKDAHLAELEQRAQARIAELEQEHRVVVDRLKDLLDQAVKDTQAQAAQRGPGADAARRNAERVGRLAAAMAADLKSAAETAGDAARDVLNALPPGVSGRDAAERAMEASQRSAELARHLARMSTRYMGQVNRVDISYCVRQQEMLLHHLAGPDIDVQFELAQGLSSLELDAQDVTQILTSLVVAARDALPLGGVIEITTSTQRNTPPDGARVDQPRPLVLAVTARGYGIRPVSSAPCEEVTVRCNGLLTTVIEPNVSWTLMAMLPGGLAEDVPVAQDLTRSA